MLFEALPKVRSRGSVYRSCPLMSRALTAFLVPSAAEAEAEAESSDEKALSMAPYETALKSSWVWQELNEVRNVRPSFNTRLGIWGGMLYSGLDTLFFKGRTPWTFRNKSGLSDAAHTKRARYVFIFISPSENLSPYHIEIE